MKMPKVGECVYAFQFNYGERIGELEFLTSTQEHATGSLKLLNKEIKSADTERRESCDPPDTEEYDTVLWAMIRIK